MNIKNWIIKKLENEEVNNSYKPRGFNFKKKILSYLKGNSKGLPARN